MRITFYLPLILLGVLSACASKRDLVYIQTNDPRDMKNAIVGYTFTDGELKVLASGPFLTNGTGINNDTNGKLGPNDNDTPIVIDRGRRLLFTVNTHSNTIAVFRIHDDGVLEHVDGSPFSSHGIAPNSLSLAKDFLLVSNRNEDYHQRKALFGAESANYVSFRIMPDGALKFVSKISVGDFQKPTQIHAANSNPKVAFGNDFQVDVDFDGAGKRSFLAGPKPRVQGQLHSFLLSDLGELREKQRLSVEETKPDYRYLGMPNVVSMPLGVWSHPYKDLLYVGLVTRNELGVYKFDGQGQLSFLNSVSNSGQDICWLLANKAGTRLYTVNNLPRSEKGDKASTLTTYDISGDLALRPSEISRIQLPHPGEWFVNNRQVTQPGSTAFQMNFSSDEKFLFVVAQRVDQTQANKNEEGNFLHVLEIGSSGIPSVRTSRDLRQDGIVPFSRPQGIGVL